MKKLKIAVVEDNSSVIHIIKSAVSDSFRQEGVQTDVSLFLSFEDLNRSLKDESYDLLFLDIKTKTIDGIEFADGLREKDDDTDIVFISSKEERVFDTFKVKPFAFVRKSNFLSDISSVIQRYVSSKKEESGQKTISFLSHGIRVNQNIENILYIEGKGIYQMVHFKDKEENPLEISSKMEILEKELSPLGFIRVHKGYLVNFLFIKSIESDNTLKLSDGEILPVSRRKIAEVKKTFLELCDKNGVLLF